MKTALAAAAGVAILAICAGASATLNQFWVQVALPGDNAQKFATVLVDAPLTISRDAAGRVHLGVALPPPLAPQVGMGLISLQVAGSPDYRMQIDGAIIPFRVIPPPAGPGPWAPGRPAAGFSFFAKSTRRPARPTARSFGRVCRSLRAGNPGVVVVRIRVKNMARACAIIVVTG